MKRTMAMLHIKENILMLVIMGFPGIGKSYISRRLSKDLYMPIFSIYKYANKLVADPKLTLDNKVNFVKELHKVLLLGKRLNDELTEKVISIK